MKQNSDLWCLILIQGTESGWIFQKLSSSRPSYQLLPSNKKIPVLTFQTKASWLVPRWTFGKLTVNISFLRWKCFPVWSKNWLESALLWQVNYLVCMLIFKMVLPCQDFKEEMQLRRRERGKGAPTKGTVFYYLKFYSFFLFFCDLMFLQLSTI